MEQTFIWLENDVDFTSYSIWVEFYCSNMSPVNAIIHDVMMTMKLISMLKNSLIKTADSKKITITYSMYMYSIKSFEMFLAQACFD